MELLTLLMIIILGVSTNVSAVQQKPGCQTSCGNVSIPYPFGIGTGCFMEDRFSITCNSTDNNNISFTPLLFLEDIPYQVLDISLDGQVRINGPEVAVQCYPSSSDDNTQRSFVQFDAGRHFVSPNRNKFTVVSCDTYATVDGHDGRQMYEVTCRGKCEAITEVVNGSCSRAGCCQVAVPEQLKAYNISLDSYNTHPNFSSFNPCSRAFIAEDEAYKFSSLDLTASRSETMSKKIVLPLILDWVVGYKTCSEAQKYPEFNPCKDNAICQDTGFGFGYLCSCDYGFQGNPYLTNGCKDIDECETLKPCNSTCHNTFGSFSCSCPEGYEGDGLVEGKGCSPKANRTNWRQIVGGVIIGVLSISLIIIPICLAHTKIKKIKLKEKYFKQNGGFFLRKQLREREGCGEIVQLFTDEELKKATNNYQSAILGQGGQGTVYKGKLADNRVVAIKKSRIGGDQSQIEPFVNEIIVLCQINHRNVVKLLGCCFETQVPTLVYEFVDNGTLFDHLHNAAAADACSFLPWEERLRIATETAEAISYLHSAASVPIIHRDIKLANILLDKNYTAKVSDFGASRFIPSDLAEIKTIVKGTFGYLDPEYMQTGVLTEKSDVYSFGIVLIELLTGEKVISFERSQQKRVLAMHFVSSMKDGLLIEILDPRVVKNENLEQLKAVAAVARKCVAMEGEERPTMKDVVHELAGLRAKVEMQ